MFVCWTYFYSPKYGHRKEEEGKIEEQIRVPLTAWSLNLSPYIIDNKEK